MTNSSNKPIVYVLVGVPGSGKSTWAANQSWAADCAYISTDKLVEAEAQRQNKTYNEVFKEYIAEVAVAKMTDEVVDARSAGKNIIWDQTSVNVGSRKKKFQMLPDYYHIAVVFKTPDPQELSRRLAARPGKTIPPAVIESMIRSWQTPTKEEGFEEIWFV